MSPSEKLFQLVTDILNEPYKKYVLWEGGAFIKRHFLCWPIKREDENDELIYYGVNPNEMLIYELDNPDQDPLEGIVIYSDEDIKWLIEDLTEFLKEMCEDFAFDCLPFPPEAAYLITENGLLYSLS